MHQSLCIKDTPSLSFSLDPYQSDSRQIRIIAIKMQGGTLQEESEIDQEYRGKVGEGGTTPWYLPKDPTQQIQGCLSRAPTSNNQKGEKGRRDT